MNFLRVSIVRMLVGVLLVLVIVFGLYVYKNGGVNILQRPADNIPSVATSTPRILTQNQVMVPELGISLVLPGGIDDFYYVIKGGLIFFSRTSLKTISPLCNAEGAPFGLLELISKKDLSKDGTDMWYLTKEGLDSAVELGLAKDFGDQYLVYISPQDATCTTAVSNPWGFDLRYLVSTAERIAN